MKAVVMDIRGSQAAVLCQDGCVRKIKNRNFTIGAQIRVSKVQKVSRHLLTMVASIAFFLVVGGTGAYAYYSPYAYVTVDVNPSIEYVLNRFNKVIEVQAYNPEGNDILKGVQYETGEYSDIRNVLKSTLGQLYSKKYIGKKQKDYIVIATAAKSEKKNQELSVMSDELIRQYQSQGKAGDITSEIFLVSTDMETMARDLGTTMGRVELVKKATGSLEALNEDELQEWLNKPIPELVADTSDVTVTTTSQKEETGTGNQNSTGSAIQDGNADKNQGICATGPAVTPEDPKDVEDPEEPIQDGNANKNQGIEIIDPAKDTDKETSPLPASPGEPLEPSIPEDPQEPVAESVSDDELIVDNGTQKGAQDPELQTPPTEEIQP